jgi:hypothetical protein
VRANLAGRVEHAILLSALVLYFGIHEAVPIVTIALLVASVTRVVVYRRDVDLAVVGWFLLGSLPGVILGTVVFTTSAPTFLTRLFVSSSWARSSGAASNPGRPLILRSPGSSPSVPPLACSPA